MQRAKEEAAAKLRKRRKQKEREQQQRARRGDDRKEREREHRAVSEASAPTVYNDGSSVMSRASIDSSEWDYKMLLHSTQDRLSKETRAMYLVQLQQAYREGLCPKPDPAASEEEMGTILSNVMQERMQQQRVKRAITVIVVVVYAVEVVARFLKIPVRIEGIGLYMHREFLTGRYNAYLEQFYTQRLAHYNWHGKLDLMLAGGGLLFGFLNAKYGGHGSGTAAQEGGAPLPEQDNSDRPADMGNNNLVSSMLNIFGGVKNIFSLFQAPTGAAPPQPTATAMQQARNMVNAAGTSAPSPARRTMAHPPPPAAPAPAASQATAPPMVPRAGSGRVPLPVQVRAEAGAHSPHAHGGGVPPSMPPSMPRPSDSLLHGSGMDMPDSSDDE